MLSSLKSYLFGGGPGPASAVVADHGGLIAPQTPVQEASFIINSITRSDDEDWVLVDSQEVIGDLPEGLDGVNAAIPGDLEESWIVTQQDKGHHRGHHHSHNHHHSNKKRGQPKGTKPRRIRSRKSSSSSSSCGGTVGRALPASLEDAESNSSSIAIVPSPEPHQPPAAARPAPSAAAAVLAASSDAQQVAAISAARTAKAKSDKSWISRKNLVRGNQTAMAASGRNNRRSQLMGMRLCGSNNNRNSHKY